MSLTADLIAEPECAALFVPAAFVQALLDVEAALALARAEVGLQSLASAREVEAACRVEQFDVPALVEAGRRGGTVVAPLVAALAARLSAEAEAELHAGATSQDLLDTALVLQTRRALALIEAEVFASAQALIMLAQAHPLQPALARTLLQPAGVIPLKLRLAQWLQPLLGGIEPLRAAAAGALQLQFGGSAGQGGAAEVGAALGRRLGLAVPPLCWQTRRGEWLRLASELALLSGAAAKIATDLALLSLPEVGEARFAGGGGSSAMPHKRNPAALARVLAASHAQPQRLAALFSAMPQQFERALGPWQAELAAWPELVISAHAALAALREALQGLSFDTARLQVHIDAQHGAVHAEALARALAPRLGRAAAQAQVGAWCAQLGPGVHLRDLAGPEFAAVFAAPLDEAAAEAALAGWRQRLPQLQRADTHAPTA
jgi:3-carboxy-cis,cis-muconate cycloisomerase